jgi:hypothetical protein
MAYSCRNDFVESAEELRNLIVYKPKKGIFIWRKIKGSDTFTKRHNRYRAGTVIDTDHKNNNPIVAMFNNKRERVHRLAFLYMTGKWPKGEVWHKNGNIYDNRWANLSDVGVIRSR